MKRILIIFIATFFTSFNAIASDLDIALQRTYVACVGIDDMLTDMKKLAGINTAVTGVGTVAGGGALIAGIKKKNLLNRLREIEQEEGHTPPSDNKIVITQQPDFKPSLKSKSKKLGNWRTGLLAVNTATNIAGAVIASKNTNNQDLESKIQTCLDSMPELERAMMQAKMDQEDITEANDIYHACSEYKNTDVSVITKRAKGATISSAVGGGVGVVGVITSASANKASGEKEQKLDTASNVLAGGATALSGAATVFNVMQISAIKKIVNVAEQCEGLLK